MEHLIHCHFKPPTPTPGPETQSLKGTPNHWFWVSFFSLNMFGQPRWYGWHQKKFPQYNYGGLTAFWSTRASVNLLELMFTLLTNLKFFKIKQQKIDTNKKNTIQKSFWKCSFNGSLFQKNSIFPIFYNFPLQCCIRLQHNFLGMSDLIPPRYQYF